MVDLLGMFRRRPAKRTAGFARPRADIAALGDSFGGMLTSPVRDAPPIARDAPVPRLDLPRSEPYAPPPAPAEKPRPRPNANSKPAKTPARTNGAAGAPRLATRA